MDILLMLPSLSLIVRSCRMLVMTAALIWTAVGGLTSASAQSATYGYDALGRLTSVTYANGSATTYTYDPAGNRAQVNTTVPTVSASLTASPATITQGSSTTLTWLTTNATSASISNGVGGVTPVSGGSVSVSPSVTTTYTLTATGPGGSANAPATVTVNDYSVMPWTWPTQSIVTAATYGSKDSPGVYLSGFNQSVTLRVQTPNVTPGGLNAGGIYVLRNDGSGGGYNYISDPGGYVDMTFQPGDKLHLAMDAHSWFGATTGSANITIRNLSDGNALLTSFTLNLAIGPDYSVTPWTWPTQSIVTTATYGSKDSPGVYLSGFNQPVTLRVQTPNVTPGGLNAGGIYVLRNDVSGGGYNYISDPGGYVDVTFQPGDKLHLAMDAHSWFGATTGSATITVRNLSDGNALLTSFTLNLAVGQ